MDAWDIVEGVAIATSPVWIPGLIGLLWYEGVQRLPFIQHRNDRAIEEYRGRIG